MITLDGHWDGFNPLLKRERRVSRAKQNSSPQKLLVGCDHCDAVIPVVIRKTGEISPVGTGGVCPSESHTFTIRGQTISA